MDRRHFLAGLGGGLAGGLTGIEAEARGTPGKAALLSTYVTNVEDKLGTDPVPVRRDVPVVLTRIHDREYDASTIAVATTEGRIIGYLPTNQSRIMAPLLDAGLQAAARVMEAKNYPRPSVRIEIRLAVPTAA